MSYLCDIIQKIKDFKMPMIIAVIVFLLFLIWYKIPNPKTIEVEPLLNLKPINNKITYEAKVSKIEGGTSIFNTISSLTSLSKYKDVIELTKELNSLVETSNNFKLHKETIEIPINSGKGYFEEINLYSWKKTYKRFFSDEEISEINVIISLGSKFYYFKGKFDVSFISIKGTWYVGEFL